MAYNNLQNRVTSVETAAGFTNGTGLSYSAITLTSGIPHVDQLEVERIFDLDFTVTVAGSPVNVQDNISASDLHKIFLLQKTDYTLNEGTSTLTNISIPGGRTYTITKAKNANLPVGTSISIPSFVNSEKVIVRRKTLSFDPYVTWTAGTRLTSEQLNLQVQQLIRLNQELIYKLESEYLRVNDIAGDNAPAFDVANSLDMGNNKIINLATPINVADGATKGYIDTALANYVTTAGTQTISGAKTFTNAITLSNNLTVDTDVLTVNATTNRVGISTTSPAGALGVVGDIVIGNQASTGTSGTLRLISSAGVNYIQSGQAVAGASAATLVISPYGGGPEFMRAQAAGVGIGSIGSSPVSRLHVHEAAAATATDIRLTSAVTGATVSDGLALRLDSAGAAYLWNYENTSLLFGTNAIERMRINANGTVAVTGNTTIGGTLAVTEAITATGGVIGNASSATTATTAGTVTTAAQPAITSVGTLTSLSVSGSSGIGISSPVSKLHVHEVSAATAVDIRLTSGTTGSTAADGFAMRLDSSGAAYVWNFENTPMLFGTNATERMRILANGNVGIGTTNPSQLLVVSNNGAEGIEVVPTGIIQSYNRSTLAHNIMDMRGSSYSFKIGTTERASINASGDFLLSGGTLGYTTGSGGTVTQTTSKTTAVTLNKPSGTITMFAGTSIAAGGAVIFTLNNSFIQADDVVVANHASGGGTANAYVIQVLTVSTGSVGLRVASVSASALAEAVKINFAVIKGSTT